MSDDTVELTWEQTTERAQHYERVLRVFMMLNKLPAGGPCTMALLSLAANSFLQGPGCGDPAVRAEFVNMAGALFDFHADRLKAEAKAKPPTGTA